MRNLLILVGSQLQGKSTWIKENNLTEHTLSMDTLRTMFLPSVSTVEGKVTIPGDKNDLVFNTFSSMLESRMNAGSFIVIDNMNNRESDLTGYKNLCQIYGYKMWYKDFRNTHTLEQCLLLNEIRISNYIPPEGIELHYNLAANLRIHKNITKIDSVDEIPDYWGINFRKFKKEDFGSIYYIGDVHGCLDDLDTFLDRYYSLDSLFIFTGDYVDRGPDSVGVMRKLSEIHSNGNVILLEGNHEKWVRLYGANKDNMIKNKGFISETIPQFNSLDKKGANRFTRSDARSFSKKLRVFAAIDFEGIKLFACHGGVNLLNTLSKGYKPFSANQYISGTGNYSNLIGMYTTDPLMYQGCINPDHNLDYVIHGHRNRGNITRSGKYVNLEGGVESGGKLKSFKIYPDGQTENIEIESTYNYLTDGNMAVSEFRDSDHIKESILAPGLSAFNFTRELFYKRSWSRITVKARGLFVNTINNTVEARSYNKFFNIGELDETNLSKIAKVGYPLEAFEKGNGYLGITSNNSLNDELLVCSKSTNKGEYANNFRRMLEENVDMIKLNDFCRAENVSLVFEVVDPVFDPHIISYPKEELILLDVIPNSFVYSAWDFTKLEDVLKLIKTGDNIRVKRLEAIVENFNQLVSYMRYHRFSKSEGFVFRDTTGYMFKYKTSFYSFLKLVRGHMERCEKEDTSTLPITSLMGTFKERGLFTDNEKDADTSIISKVNAMKFLAFAKTEAAFGNYNIVSIYEKYKGINQDFLEPLKP